MKAKAPTRIPVPVTEQLRDEIENSPASLDLPEGISVGAALATLVVERAAERRLIARRRARLTAYGAWADDEERVAANAYLIESARASGII